MSYELPNGSQKSTTMPVPFKGRNYFVYQSTILKSNVGFQRLDSASLGGKSIMVHGSLASAIYLLVVCSERDHEQKSQKAEELI